MQNKIKQFGLKRLLVLLFTICLAFTSVCVAGCGPSEKPTTEPPSTEREVKSIAISKEPAKTEYFVGEEFSAEGGEITVSYTDNSTETKKMTDEGVTISEVKTTINDEKEDSETKTVTVRYGKKSATFKITVSYQMFDVTFDLCYEGATNEVKTVRKDSKVERPADPTRENYNFFNWYADSACTALYDFGTAITGDTTIYAKWLENAVYYDVKFDLNYAGAVTMTPQKVKEGEKVSRPTTDPERRGYAFRGWYTSSEGNTVYDFDTAITGAISVFAKWEKTVSGRNWYVFEAEDSNLDGKSGPGLSGTAGGPGMIQLTTDLGASNDRFVGYQYEIGCSLVFQFNSDVTIGDATIVMRLSAELRDFDIDPESYKMQLNGQDLSYERISFTNVPKGSSDDVDTIHALPFKDYTITVNATIREGLNVFTVVTMNDDAMSGTTMLSKAPLVDCLKIETEAVLDWAAQLGLPKNNY